MRVVEAPLPGILLIEPRVHRDERGFFVETYHSARYREAGLPAEFVQDNQSRSVQGTLRGLHWQWRRPQGKLVRAIEGAIFDVAVDIRPESTTFGHWFGTELTADNFRQMFIPAGFAHGFCVLSPSAQIEYKCTDYYDADGEGGLAWNDPDVGIAWPVQGPILSGRDQQHQTFVARFGRRPAGRP
jgi:dTDP-4-dehydrorhamnose 3,5-epimerase